MKKMLLLSLIAIAAFLTGCATATRGTQSDATLIQSVLDKLLPADFNGPIELSHANQYFDLTIRGADVHKNAGGQWTWTWLEYERNSHFPIFSGVQWSSSGKVRLGNPR